MKITKIIISLFLLLTYSLGIAHNIIPHQHDGADHQHVSEGHQEDGHHHLSNDSNTEHKHIPHGDHFDEDMYELLVCFLHQSESKENDCNKQHYTPAKTYRSLINKDSQLNASLLDNLHRVELKETSLETINFTDQAFSLLLSSCSTLRGPPSYIA